MKINWRVRAKNKTFWLTVIPAVLLIVQIITGWFNYDFAADIVGDEAARLVNAVFAVLVILGIVVDPTVDGIRDSTQARRYLTPKKEHKNE